VMLGGVAAGVAGSRLLPPLISQAIGSLKVRRGADPFERLIEDHRQITALLHQMEQVPDGEMTRRSKLFLQLKRTLAKHAMAEEDIVYPLLQGTAGAADQVRRLYNEHVDIKMHLYELEQLLKARSNWVERVHALRAIIENHARDEEENEFPKLKQSMGQTRHGELASLIRREEALVL
jgi:iron-sulfur cluster repair protein YtfE (RIC family)